MTLRPFIAPSLFLIAFSFWYCQKTPLPELKSELQNAAVTDERASCPISNPGLDPACNAQIRVRCVNVAPGHTYSIWWVQASFHGYDNGVAQQFNFNMWGNPFGGFQQGVWYDIPRPLTKQYLLDANCTPGTGNGMECIVYTAGGEGNLVSQWNMWVDIRSGNKITTYHMNAAAGILTPVPLEFLPNQNVAFEWSDIDFLTDCSNMGAQGILCNPALGCAECSVTAGGGEK